jgi:hypothetical protein
LSCFSITASHNGTRVVIPGWNGPKSPCYIEPVSGLPKISRKSEIITHTNEIKHAVIVADAKMRDDVDELLLRLYTKSHTCN